VASTTFVSGNLTRDPEIRYLADGTAMTTFCIAVNRRWQEKSSGTWNESTSFLDVACWRELAEHAAMSLTKGDRVLVNGYLEQRSWTSTEGKARSRIELVAQDLGPSLRFRPVSPHEELRV
jgi:single-strand DNA-binding protein